jgi:thioredoxin reductase (NADPH)
MNISGLFVAVGVAGSTDLAKKIGASTENNKILVDGNMATNIPGLYAAGDCTGGLLQISKAVYEGS